MAAHYLLLGCAPIFGSTSVWQRFLGRAVMSHERIRRDGRRQNGGGKFFEACVISEPETRNFERVKRKHISMRAIGRPWSAVTARKTGNVEGNEITVEFARAGRHRGGPTRAFQKFARIGGYVEDQPMGERAGKIELRRQIWIGHTDCEALGARWHSGPCETGRRLIFFRKTIRDDRSVRDIRGGKVERLVRLRADRARGLDQTRNGFAGFFRLLARPGDFVRVRLVGLTRQRRSRASSKHCIQNSMAIVRWIER